MRWQARDVRVENSHITLDRDRLRERYVNVPDDLRAKLLAVMNNPDRPVADAFPEFESLIYGTDGTLWLRDYERPGDTRHRWTALDPSGAVACVLETPVFDEIAAFGRDFMVVVEDLEDGREVVSRYRITP